MKSPTKKSLREQTPINKNAIPYLTTKKSIFTNMKKIFTLLILMLYGFNSSWAQCPTTVTISGPYATTYTGSHTWIASSGLTTIPTGANVTLDANPVTNGYVLLDTGFETQPNSIFLAVVVTPCSLLANETFSDATSFSTYPNPVTSLLNIEASSLIRSITIMDVNGRIILEKENDSRATSINTEMLTSGMYLLKVTTDEVSAIQKFIKK